MGDRDRSLMSEQRAVPGRPIPPWSWMSHRLLLIALLAAYGMAEDSWTVPAQPAPLIIEAPGFVVPQRTRANQMTSPAKDLLIRDLLPQGARVVRGQRVVTFDTTRTVTQVPVRVHDLEIAEAQARRQVLEAESRIASLEARRISRRAELATARAALAALGQSQQVAIARAEARLAQSRQAEATALRAAKAAALRAEVGDLATDEAEEAHHRHRLAGFDRQEAELALEAAHTGTPTRRKSLLRRILDLQESLGLKDGPDGTEVVDPGAGLEKEIAWAQANLDQARNQARSQVEAARISLQDARRQVADAVPLAWMTATPIEGGETRRIDLLPQVGGTPAPGWLADRGEVWDTRRGYGWQSPPGDAGLPPRELPTTPTPESTVRVLDAPAVFHWQLPPGTWRLDIGLGDHFPWSGSVIAIDGVGVVHVANEIEANKPVTVTAQVRVAGEPVTLRFGDEPGRGLRALTNGLMVHGSGSRRGGKSGWSRRALAWVVDPAAVRIAVRIPAALQPLFSTGTKVEGPLAALAVHRAEILPPDGSAALPARVEEVSQRPVSLRASANGWDDQEVLAPDDGVARELTLAPEAGVHLLPRTSVTLRATIALPAGTWAVPPHLVRRDPTQTWVRTGFGRRVVTAYAVGPAVLVTEGLKAGDRLYPVPLTDETENPSAPPANGLLTGRLAAGSRVLIPAPATWGRVQDLLPDGSEVKTGDQVMSLYNPWLEGRSRERADAQRRVIEEAAREEQQRNARAEAIASDRLQEREAERTARQDFLDAADPPPDESRAGLPARLARTATELERAEARAKALATIGGETLAAAEMTRARARITDTRSTLEAAQKRFPGWRSVAEARNAWEKALFTLGLRPGRDAIAAAESRSALISAQARRSSGQWELEVAADFERLRRITAPASGRLRWLDGHNEQTRTMSVMARDLSVWGGMPLGEILDLSALDLVVEVPEQRYGDLAIGQRLTVTLPDRGDLRLGAVVTVIGGVLAPPADRRDQTGLVVADSRVVTVRARLESVPSLKPPLAPGLRALVEFPSPLPPGDRP